MHLKLIIKFSKHCIEKKCADTFLLIYFKIIPILPIVLVLHFASQNICISHFLFNFLCERYLMEQKKVFRFVKVKRKKLAVQTEQTISLMFYKRLPHEGY